MIYDIGDETRQATGLLPGDVIFLVNRQPITGAQDLQRLFRTAPGRSPVRVYFERGGQMGYSDLYVQ